MSAIAELQAALLDITEARANAEAVARRAKDLEERVAALVARHAGNGVSVVQDVAGVVHVAQD